MYNKKMVERTTQHTTTVNYTYDMFKVSLVKLTERLRKFDFDGIYAIPRGGYVYGLFLSHQLKLPIVKEPTENTLIVDDICDTGNTLIKYPNNVKTVLVTKVAGAINVSNLFYDIVYNDNQWVRFFWENE